MADPPDVTVHGVLTFAMPAGTPRQQARNCGLKQRGSLNLEQGVSLDLEQRVWSDLKQRGSLDLEQRLLPDLKQWGSLNIEQRGSPCQSPPKILPEFLPSGRSR